MKVPAQLSCGCLSISFLSLYYHLVLCPAHPFSAERARLVCPYLTAEERKPSGKSAELTRHLPAVVLLLGACGGLFPDVGNGSARGLLLCLVESSFCLILCRMDDCLRLHILSLNHCFSKNNMYFCPHMLYAQKN